MCVSAHAFSQTGQTCNQAVTIVTNNACSYSSHTTSGTEYWLKFIATSPTVNISLITTKFGLNATHIHRLGLYDGICTNLYTKSG